MFVGHLALLDAIIIKKKLKDFSSKIFFGLFHFA